MKIVLVNTFDHGGATRAAYRLHEGLRKAGVDSSMLVRYNSHQDSLLEGKGGMKGKVLGSIASRLDAMPLWSYPKRDPEVWSSQWLSNDTVKQIERLKPDIVHLHWIGQGFLPIKAFSQIKQPLIWTMHDMWGMTGGCHYDRQCGRWKTGCGECPQLHSVMINDWSRKTWLSKQVAWKDVAITAVSPSRWLADEFRSSPLFQERQVHVIANGIDMSVFRPLDKAKARQELGLPLEGRLIVFGALGSTLDPRKGYKHLQAALKILAKRDWHKQAIVGIFGADKPVEGNDFGFPTHYLGKIADEGRLASLYSAADIFIAPSTQDNLPNTVVEALACGTPCAAFNIGGMSDMIEHQQNGYLAKPFDVEDLASGIEWVLTDQPRHQKLCISAREKAVQFFSQEGSVAQYQKLYEQVLS